MKVAFIMPTKLLDSYRLEKENTIHLALAQEALRDQEYYDWYKGAIKRGEHVILDNGAYELGESVGHNDLLNLTDDLHPTEVVCPDVLFDAYATINRTKEFLIALSIRELTDKVTPFVVPQGKTIDEWVMCLTVLLTMCNQAGFQKPTVGILTRLGELVPGKHRREVFNLIQSKYPETRTLLRNKCNIHFLGCDDKLEELYKPVAEFIRSTDTAKIVTLSMAGVDLAEVNNVPRIKRADNFFDIGPDDIDPCVTALIRRNIDEVISWQAKDIKPLKETVQDV